MGGTWKQHLQWWIFDVLVFMSTYIGQLDSISNADSSNKGKGISFFVISASGRRAKLSFHHKTPYQFLTASSSSMKR